jgi:hypothetical protein
VAVGATEEDREQHAQTATEEEEKRKEREEGVRDTIVG